MKYLNILAHSKTAGDKSYGLAPYFFMLAGCTFWPLSWIYANEHNINFAQITIIRALVCIVMNYIVCLYTDSPMEMGKGTFGWLVARNMIMSIHSLVFSVSQFILPLPIVHTLSCTGVLFIFIVDYLMFGTKINSKQTIGIIIGIVGSMVASNGRLITQYFDPTYEYQSHFQNYMTDDPFVITIFSFFFLAIIIVWGFGVVITKKAVANTFQINFNLGFCMLFTGSLAYPYIESKASLSSLFLALFFTALPMILGQWLFIGSLTMTKDTGVLNMMNFWSIFVGYMVSIFRYHQSPNLVTTIGVGLVFWGVWMTIFNKSKPVDPANEQELLRASGV